MLTVEEAKQVAADDRVEQVVPQSIIDMSKEKEEAIFTGRFAKGIVASDYTTFTRSDGGTSQKFTADHRIGAYSDTQKAQTEQIGVVTYLVFLYQ